MRFCHLTTFYPPYHYGGDAIITQAVCEQLAAMGHEVEVVYCRDAFEFDGFETTEQRSEVPGLTIHELSHPLRPLSPLITHQTGRPGLKHQALKQILDQDFDVVHFHNISLVGGPGILKLSQAEVTLYSLHEHWLFCPTHVLWKFGSRPCEKPQCLRCTLKSRKPPQLWRYTNLTANALEHVDCLLAPSRFTAQRHEDAGITRPIVVLPFFSPIQGAETVEFKSPQNPTFIYSGRLETSKGIEQLLEAIVQRPAYRLVVAGSGRLESALREQYRNIVNIEFLGHIPHTRIREQLVSATAAIVPAWGPEVSPLSVLEALSCRTPVIVRRSGGSAEVIENGGGGWVYDHPEELLPLLDKISADPRSVLEMREAASRNAQQNLGIDLWMDRYFELIEQLGKGRRNS
jgi:glycosyltransferase involved in cell wall biosynthesis